MRDSLLKVLSMESHHPSTILSMDSSTSSSQDELDLEMNLPDGLTCPPDINLPFSVSNIPPPPIWNSDCGDIVDVGHHPQSCETENALKIGKKCVKIVDSIWGAWFFFTFYFRPALKDKLKGKIVNSCNGVSGFDKSDIQLETFMVQHDMENMYMWVFKERRENALGKMQLRSYMNGHSRHGERPFPFSVDKGFVRSHRMQRKHYRGLSNPQCIHGIEVVSSPNLASLDEYDRKRWAELTGRDFNTSIPSEASDFSSWRNLPIPEFEQQPPLQIKSNPNSINKKLLNGSDLNLSTNNNEPPPLDLSPMSKKQKHFFPPEVAANPRLDMIIDPLRPHWAYDFSGVMANVRGPVTAAKTIYEDESSYLIMISLPFVDLQTVKVSWRNTITHGIVKVCCLSTSCAPYVKRCNRTFKMVDPSSEHCPQGEFMREIPLATRIPEDANMEAYYDGSGTTLEIIVPKPCGEIKEHEVVVCRRPHTENSNKEHLMLA